MSNPLVKQMNRRLCLFGLAGVVGLVAGCSSGRIKPMKLDGSAWPSVSAYSAVTVTPFVLGPKVTADPALGAQMAEGIARRLRTEFGPVFTQVRTGAPLGLDNEMVILGQITEFNLGNDGGGGGALGIDAASLNGVMRLQDAADTQDLASGKFDELRANAGLSGQSRNMADLVANTESAIAFTVARAKGWKPAGAP